MKSLNTLMILSVLGGMLTMTHAAEIQTENTDQITTISNWLTEQVVPIKAVRTNNIAEGIAILNGRLRSPLFAEFMKERTRNDSERYLGLSEELWKLIKKHLKITK